MDPNHPFPEAPSPWSTKATVLCTAARAKGLPPGSYNDLEAEADFATKYGKEEDFRGGLCYVMIIRYKETPVGPYDEIIWIPGSFRLPGSQKNRLRITRIYVSGVETVYNGRKNWNIPKELANFTFTPADPSTSFPPYSKITISPLNGPSWPFVELDLHPTGIPLLSRPLIPISTARLPMSLDAVMPPLPQSEKWREDGMMGTNMWVKFRPAISGRAAVIRVGGKLGDGTRFPGISRMRGDWVWIEDARIECETAGTWEGLPR